MGLLPSTTLVTLITIIFPDCSTSSIQHFIEVIKGGSNFNEGLSEEVARDVEAVGEILSFHSKLQINTEKIQGNNEMSSYLVKSKQDSQTYKKLEDKNTADLVNLMVENM